MNISSITDIKNLQRVHANYSLVRLLRIFIAANGALDITSDLPFKICEAANIMAVHGKGNCINQQVRDGDRVLAGRRRRQPARAQFGLHGLRVDGCYDQMRWFR